MKFLFFLLLPLIVAAVVVAIVYGLVLFLEKDKASLLRSLCYVVLLGVFRSAYQSLPIDIHWAISFSVFAAVAIILAMYVLSIRTTSAISVGMLYVLSGQIFMLAYEAFSA